MTNSLYNEAMCAATAAVKVLSSFPQQQKSVAAVSAPSAAAFSLLGLLLAALL